MGGLTCTVAPKGIETERFIRINFSLEAIILALQVPVYGYSNLCNYNTDQHIPTPAIQGITKSPTLSEDTFEPTAVTLPTPSLPPMAGNWGLIGYVPVK